MSMEEKETEVTYESVQKALSTKVWKNEGLRKEILANPKETIEKELGISFGENMEVQVIDQTDPKSVTLVLPVHPNNRYGVEFSDAQLDAIAGGSYSDIYVNQPGINVTFTAPNTMIGTLTEINKPTMIIGVNQSS